MVARTRQGRLERSFVGITRLTGMGKLRTLCRLDKVLTSFPGRYARYGSVIIEKSLGGFRATVPCKVNLFLEVLGKRFDGYHSLDTVMMAVSLVDELEITHRSDGRLELVIEFPKGFGQRLDGDDLAWDIPADQSNLVIVALERLRSTLGKTKLGANVKLIKRIPARAGLGGGSADAAAAIILGLLLWGASDQFDKARIIASEIAWFRGIFAPP